MIGETEIDDSPALTTRVGCREVILCSGVGASVTWRRASLGQPLETGGNILISVSALLDSLGCYEH